MKPRRRPPLVIVAALGRNGAIGRGNALPWSMPGDLARFRETTMDTPMIMGRRTYEAIGRPLPGRESIVVTGHPEFPLPPGVHRARDPYSALEIATARARAMRALKISLIGGAMLFEALIDQADLLELTIVDLEPDADTFFPTIDPAAWSEVVRTAAPRHSHDEAACELVSYHSNSSIY